LKFAAHLFELHSVAKIDGKIIYWQNNEKHQNRKH